MGSYFTKKRAKKLIPIGLILLGFSLGLASIFLVQTLYTRKPEVPKKQVNYWLMLHRKSGVELLYKGKAGSASESELVKAFRVKTGVSGQRPTPLPQLLGKKYWVVTKKYDTSETPESAPYFIELNVPAPTEPPYGPTPYKECDGNQCNWEISGPFGLHGINGDLTRLDSTNIGSSGCIRHTDEDITYLYNLLDPEKEEIRYYIKDI